MVANLVVVIFMVVLALLCMMVKKQANKNDSTKDDEALIKLGKHIRSLRVAQGYSSAEKFSLAHNLSRVHYGRWEAGKKNITYKSLLVLAKAFKMSLSEFFEGLD